MFLLTIENRMGHVIQRRVDPHSSSFTLGRGPEAGITLTNSHFSKVQATLTAQGEGVWIVSDGDGSRPSASGLSIEGKRVVGSSLLVEGQTLTLIDLLSDPKARAAAADPVRASLKLLAKEEIVATTDITLSGVESPEMAQMGQGLLKLLRRTRGLPEQYSDICDRLAALETTTSSAAMVDTAMVGRLEQQKKDLEQQKKAHENLANLLKRKLSRIEKDKRFLIVCILLILGLLMLEQLTSVDVGAWLDLAAKGLALVALIKEMRGERR